MRTWTLLLYISSFINDYYFIIYFIYLSIYYIKSLLFYGTVTILKLNCTAPECLYLSVKYVEV